MKNPRLNIDREYDAAIKLLQKWKVIGESSGYRINSIKKILLEYYKDKTYLFGRNLLDHLTNAKKQKNVWIPEYMKDHDRAIKLFLSETTQLYSGDGNSALRNRFNDLSNNVENNISNNI